MSLIHLNQTLMTLISSKREVEVKSTETSIAAITGRKMRKRPVQNKDSKYVFIREIFSCKISFKMCLLSFSHGETKKWRMKSSLGFLDSLCKSRYMDCQIHLIKNKREQSEEYISAYTDDHVEH